MRTFEGSIESYFAYSGAGRRPLAIDGDDAAFSRHSPFWAATLPRRPDDLLDQATFTLTTEEADFLKDRLIIAQPESLLALLARDRDAAECDYIWEHPNRSNFPRDIQAIIAHGERFSHLMEGAALLYNLMLAERLSNDEWAQHYREGIAAWRNAFDAGACRAWALDRLWDDLIAPGHEIRSSTRRFVTEWRDAALSGLMNLEDDAHARRLIETRERQLKKKQSRFENRAVLDRWGGASGIGRLDFRWPVAHSHLMDLADAD